MDRRTAAGHIQQAHGRAMSVSDPLRSRRKYGQPRQKGPDTELLCSPPWRGWPGSQQRARRRSAEVGSSHRATPHTGNGNDIAGIPDEVAAKLNGDSLPGATWQSARNEMQASIISGQPNRPRAGAPAQRGDLPKTGIGVTIEAPEWHPSSSQTTGFREDGTSMSHPSSKVIVSNECSCRKE